MKDQEPKKQHTTSELTGKGRVKIPKGPSKDLALREADEHHCNARRKKSRGYCENPPGFRTGLGPYDEISEKWRRCYLHGGSAPGTALSIRSKSGAVVGMYDKGIAVQDMATYEQAVDEMGLEQEVATARVQVASILEESIGTRERLRSALEALSSGWVGVDKKEVQSEFKVLARELDLGKAEAKEIWHYFSAMFEGMGVAIAGKVGLVEALYGRIDQLRKMTLHFLDVVGRLRDRDQKIKNELGLMISYKDVMELIGLMGEVFEQTCGTCPLRAQIAERMRSWRPWSTRGLEAREIEEAIIEEKEQRKVGVKEVDSSGVGNWGDEAEEDAIVILEEVGE